jgi:hypothetical protein
VLVNHARKGVEVGQRIDRVLREVGEAVVFQRVNVGRVEIIRSRIAERYAKTWNGWVATNWDIEAFEQAPVGIGGIADQHEVDIIARHPLVLELLHCQ